MMQHRPALPTRPARHLLLPTITALLLLMLAGLPAVCAGDDSSSSTHNASAVSTSTAPHTISTIPFKPAVPPRVHTTVTIIIGAISGVMTAILAFQIFRIHYYPYRKLSYFNACLWMTLLWGILRTSLLIQYAAHSSVAGNLSLAWYIILFVLPVCLQFGTFSLVTLYFSTVFISKADHATRRLWAVVAHCVWVLTNLAVFGISIYSTEKLSKENASHASDLKVRVIVTESLSLLNGIVLLVVVLKIKLLNDSQVVLEGHGASIKQIIIFTCLTEFLFLSRFIYNIVAVTSGMEEWGYRWTFLSDKADRGVDDGWGYIFFVGALFLWEMLPVFSVIWFFWVRKYPNFKSLKASHGSVAGPSAVYYEEFSDDEEEESLYPININRQTSDGGGSSPNSPSEAFFEPTSYGSFGSTPRKASRYGYNS